MDAKGQLLLAVKFTKYQKSSIANFAELVPTSQFAELVKKKKPISRPTLPTKTFIFGGQLFKLIK